eukprot:1650148-Pleurochrysis_carterae.AAC.1
MATAASPTAPSRCRPSTSPSCFPMLDRRRELEGDGARSGHAPEQDFGSAGPGVQGVAARDGQAPARRWQYRDHGAAHSRLCSGMEDSKE